MDPNRFECADCGVVKADEDGCCAHCGRDCVVYEDGVPVVIPVDERPKLPLVVRYLREGGTLERLLRDHGVVSRTRNGKVSLSYHQLDARRDDPLACQCRGLILREGTWDVIAYPFDRFFGAEEECAAVVDWNCVSVQEKMDGTLLIIYRDRGKWHVGTRKDPEAATVSQCGLTYRELSELTAQSMGFGSLTDFAEQVLAPIDPSDKHMTFMLELTGPENHVVCRYKQRRLWLLGARSGKDFCEVRVSNEYTPIDHMNASCDRNLCESLTTEANSRDADDHEGYVVADYSSIFDGVKRVKITSDAYRQKSHELDTVHKQYAWQWRLKAPWTSLVQMVVQDDKEEMAKMTDVCSPLVRDQLLFVSTRYEALISETRAVYRVIIAVDDDKEFASLAKRHRWPSALFAVRRGTAKTLQEHAKQMVPRHLVRILGLESDWEDFQASLGR